MIQTRTVLFLYCTIVCSCLFLPAKVIASTQEMVFLIYYETSAPYVQHDPLSDAFDGFVPVVLREAAKRANIRIRFEEEERKRAEQKVYKRLADGLILAKEWAIHPEKLMYSDPIFMQRDFLLSTRPFKPNSVLPDWIDEKVICTRVHYQYPELQTYFNSEISLRQDLSSHSEMLKMLGNGRCDLAYMGEFRAVWQLAELYPDMEVHFSPQPVSEVGFTIAVSPENRAFLKSLNQYVAQMKVSGELQKLIEQTLLPSGVTRVGLPAKTNNSQ